MITKRRTLKYSALALLASSVFSIGCANSKKTDVRFPEEEYKKYKEIMDQIDNESRIEYTPINLTLPGIDTIYLNSKTFSTLIEYDSVIKEKKRSYWDNPTFNSARDLSDNTKERIVRLANLLVSPAITFEKISLDKARFTIPLLKRRLPGLKGRLDYESDEVKITFTLSD